MKNYQSQSGFTIIELMIAITLSLIVIAAVVQIYVSSVRTGSMQKAAAGIMDANVYGLQQIEKSIRMAGLGLDGANLVDAGCSAVLLPSDAQITSQHSACANASIENLIKNISADHLTKELADSTANTKGRTSSQLTIQYRAAADMYDCEGNLAVGPSNALTTEVKATTNPKPVDYPIVDGQVIVERYFVKKSGDKLELRCDAGRYSIENIAEGGVEITGSTTAQPINYQTKYDVKEDPIIKDGAVGSPNNGQLRGFGDDGVLVVADVDEFKVRFITQPSDSKVVSYQDIATLKKDKTSKIVGIQIAILAKGQYAAPKGDMPAGQSYQIFGETASIVADQDKKYIRRVYETTITLRNAKK